MKRADRTYAGVSPFFHTWVRLVEYHTRRMEVRDAQLGQTSILIVSAPTDAGIGALTRGNAGGECFLLCFSAQLESIARDYCRRHRIRNLTTLVAPFFHIPCESERLDAVFANCLFDVCDVREFGTILDEFWRVLKRGGHLYSVHMGVPSHPVARAWAWLAGRVAPAGGGFHPVTIVPTLLDHRFSILQYRAPERLGFPLRYVEAEKPIVR